MFLEDFPDIRSYYLKNFYMILLMPIYSLISFFIRFAGIINSINRKASWKTNNLSQENTIIVDTFKDDFLFIKEIRKKLIKFMEK